LGEKKKKKKKKTKNVCGTPPTKTEKKKNRVVPPPPPPKKKNHLRKKVDAIFSGPDDPGTQEPNWDMLYMYVWVSPITRLEDWNMD